MLKWVKQKSNFFIWENKHVKNFPNAHVIPPPHYYLHNVQPDIPPWSPKLNYSLTFPQWRSTLQNIYRCFTLAPNMFSHWNVTILSPARGRGDLHPLSLSIPMPQDYLRLTSCLRGTSLLCFSNVPSNHCLQSNLTLNSECVTPSCWKFFCGSHKRNQIQGINPPPSPCSLILHTSAILNHHLSSKWS